MKTLWTSPYAHLTKHMGPHPSPPAQAPREMGEGGVYRGNVMPTAMDRARRGGMVWSRAEKDAKFESEHPRRKRGAGGGRFTRKVIVHPGLTRRLDELGCSPADIGDLTGAPPDARVEVKNLGEGFDVVAKGKGFYSYVWVQRDGSQMGIGLMQVHPTGKGVGTRAFAQIVRTARRLGIKRIRIEAMRGLEFNGYYTWPRLGFDGDLAGMRRSLPSNLRQAKTIGELFQMRGGMEWWKKHGITIPLEFDLNSGSHSMKVWQAYLRHYRKYAVKGEIGLDAVERMALDEAWAEIIAAREAELSKQGYWRGV